MICSYQVVTKPIVPKICHPLDLKHGEFCSIIEWPDDPEVWTGVICQMDRVGSRFWSLTKGDCWWLDYAAKDPGNRVERLTKSYVNSLGIKGKV